MRQLACLLSLAAAIGMIAPFQAAASNGSATYAGGSFTTGYAVGQSIAVNTAAVTAPSGNLSLSCPITSYAAGTYALNWTCAGGTVTIASADHSVVFHGSFLSGTMTYTSSGGGKGGHVTADYQFEGFFSGTVTSAGVTQFAYGSVSQSVITGGQIGGSSAPVTAGSFGWNSGYSPLLVGDANGSRVLIGDNIAGANLVSLGSSGTGVGQFGTVAGLAQDTALRIYLADSQLNRIVRVNNTTGSGWTSFGTLGAGPDQFNSPHGLAIDASGRIWVADTGNHRIVRFDDMTGNHWTTFGSYGAGTKEFNSPQSIAFDAQGRIYVADTGNNRLVRINDITGAGWTTLSQVSIGIYGYPVTGPASVAINSAGQVYVALTSGYLIRINDISGAGGSISYWGAPLTGLSIDKAETVYVAGSFAPGLAQALDATATGYFASALGMPSLQASALLALSLPQPPPAEAVMSTNALRFGSVNVGVPTTSQGLSLLNLGAAPLTFESITASADYRGTSQCPLVLAGGASCTGTLLFQPTTVGSRNANLTITTTSVHPSEVVALSGTGTAPKPVLIPTSLAFDPQRTATASGTQTVTLTNSGTGPLIIKSVAASPEFSELNNCIGVVPPGAGCTIQVAFQPSATGTITGSLTIADDAVASGAQQSIALTGSGTSTAPAFVLSPESLQFPQQQLSTTSSSQAVSLTNQSGATVSLSAPAFPSRFTGSTTCGASLSNGATCLYSISFSPTVAGPVAGNLVIPVAGKPTLTVGLSGTGVSAGSAPILTANPSTIAFGPITIGDNPSLSTTVTNSSGLPIGIASIVLTGDSTFSVTRDTCPAILPGKSTCVVEITFLPTSASTSVNTGTLSLTEGTGAVTQVSITGNAVLPGNSVKPR